MIVLNDTTNLHVFSQPHLQIYRNTCEFYSMETIVSHCWPLHKI